MENEKINRIKKASHVTARVLHVVRVILIVAIVLCIIGGISVMGIRTTDGTSIEIFGNTVTIHVETVVGLQRVDT